VVGEQLCRNALGVWAGETAGANIVPWQQPGPPADCRSGAPGYTSSLEHL